MVDRPEVCSNGYPCLESVGCRFKDSHNHHLHKEKQSHAAHDQVGYLHWARRHLTKTQCLWHVFPACFALPGGKKARDIILQIGDDGPAMKLDLVWRCCDCRLVLPWSSLRFFPDVSAAADPETVRIPGFESQSSRKEAQLCQRQR